MQKGNCRAQLGRQRGGVNDPHVCAVRYLADLTIDFASRGYDHARLKMSVIGVAKYRVLEVRFSEHVWVILQVIEENIIHAV